MRARALAMPLVAVLAVGTLGGLSPNASGDQARQKTVSALRLLKQLKTSHERNAGYDRDKFADWYDQDGDGCDTRAEVLIAESLRRVDKGSSCYVRTGRWYSRYDGQKFRRATNLDIDHMVPLAEAWGSGAKRWNDRTRARYANDLGYRFSLIAVSASSNRSKGDRDPSEWLPTRKSFRCAYAKQYTAVKFRWNLKVNPGERQVLRQLLHRCGDKSITKPRRANIDRGGGGGGDGRRCSPHYRGACVPIRADVDCSEIPDRNFRVVDEDVYNLDGDGDGIACET
jgi:hypothetical protein